MTSICMIGVTLSHKESKILTSFTSRRQDVRGGHNIVKDGNKGRVGSHVVSQFVLLSVSSIKWRAKFEFCQVSRSIISAHAHPLKERFN